MKLHRLVSRPFSSLLGRRQLQPSTKPVTPRRERRPSFPSIEGALACLRSAGFRPQLAVDVGAYHGEWTRMFKSIFPDCQVVMVEAQESKRATLEQISASLGRTTFEIGLLGACDGAPVRFVEMETGSSVFEEQSHFARAHVVRTTITLDRLLERYGTPVDLLKLDVQGYELEVLRGAARRLAEAKAVLMEVSLVPINRGCPSFADCVEFMDDSGFQLFDFCSQIRRTDGVLWQTDLLFVRRNSPLAPDPRLTPQNWA